MFVVVGHSAYLVITTTYGGVNYEIPIDVSAAYSGILLSFYRRITGWVYTFHMPLFFALSGAVLGLKELQNLKTIVKAKVKRLVIPYFLYGWFFMFPVKYLGGFYDSSSLKSAVKSFVYGVDSGHLWFLMALFWCLLAAVIIIKIMHRLQIYHSLLLLIICGVISVLCLYIIPFDMFSIRKGGRYIFWFALGYVFELERHKFKTWETKRLLSAFGVSTCVEFVLYLLLDEIGLQLPIGNSMLLMLSGIVWTYLLAVICSRFLYKFTRTKYWDAIIGSLFAIYLFHDPLEYIVLRIFFAFHWLSSTVGLYMYYFCRTVVVILISFLLGKFVECAKIMCIKCYNNHQLDKK